MLAALKKPSAGGVIIALFSWLAVPVALVGEAMIVLGKPVWWWIGRSSDIRLRPRRPKPGVDLSEGGPSLKGALPAIVR